ncbi:hypothetical protein [Modestobacter excelsi]|nr:hypothetical protein [Modestobacter excelsi]
MVRAAAWVTAVVLAMALLTGSGWLVAAQAVELHLIARRAQTARTV